MKKLLPIITLLITFWANAQNQTQTPPPLCPQPVNLVVMATTQTSATFAWTEPATSTVWEVAILPAGTPAPIDTSIGFLVSSNLFTAGPLDCGTAYDFYVRSICSEGWTSLWHSTIPFATASCFDGGGTAQNLSSCPENGQSCYDLNQNDANVLGTLDPSLFTVTYHDDPDLADTGTNPLASPFCITEASDYLFARLEENATGAHSISSFYLTAAGQCPALQFHAFLDTNNNGVLDAGEELDTNYTLMHLGHFNYEIDNDGIIHSIATYNGIHTIYDANTSASYDVEFVINPEYAAYFNGSSQTDLHTDASGTSIYYFPVTASAPYNDMGVTIAPYGAPRPGFQYSQYIGYRNNGNQGQNSGTITYTKDPAVSVVSVAGNVDFTTDGFTFNFTNVPPLQTRYLWVTLQVPTIPTVSLGQTLTTSVSVASANDAVATNDTRTLTETITGSFDPNDKLEAHGRNIVFDNFGADEYLYYTIRFENTGTASAEMIKITDVLDDQLDETTVRPIDESLSGTFERVGNSLTWRFEGIDLPPTSIDPVHSHGFVSFKVKPKPDFAIGTVIPNFASIYFDYNPAIVTEPFETHFVQALAVNEFENAELVLFPNPASDQLTVFNAKGIRSVEIYEGIGKKVQSQLFDRSASATLDIARLQSGMYFVRITTDSGSVTKKLIKK